MNTIVFTGGKILTMTDKKAEACAVWGDRIVAVGSEAEVFSLVGRYDVYDLDGRVLMPGFVDAHVHLVGYALSLERVDVDTKTMAEAIDRVSKACECNDGWVVGGGWNRNLWGQLPTKEQLDERSGDVPVVLLSKDCHAVWVNSAVLRRCGINDDTADPGGGEIVRDEHGQITGVLLETAMKLVLDKIPPPDSDALGNCLLKAQAKLHQYGITAVHNCEGLDEIRAICDLERQRKLMVDVTANVPPQAIECLGQIGFGPGAGYEGVRLGGVKVFADGALGSHTADMLEPYEGSNSKGIEVLSTRELIDIGTRAKSAGLYLVIHAIGDRAVRRALDVFEELDMGGRIEHVQLVTESDAERFADLGVTASMQPIHAPSDRDTAEHLWGDRCRYAYAWKLLADRGARLAFGSDAPIESPDPFAGLMAAVTRTMAGGEQSSWYPELAVSVAEALAGFTVGPADCVGADYGRISEGMRANLTVLDRDPFAVDPGELGGLCSELTMVRGRVAYER